MKNRFLISVLVILGLMALYALVYAVSVDVYDNLFWARFIFGLAAIALVALCGIRAVSAETKAVLIRELAADLFYALAMLCALTGVRSAGAVIFFALCFTLLFLLLVLLGRSRLSRE